MKNVFACSMERHYKIINTLPEIRFVLHSFEYRQGFLKALENGLITNKSVHIDSGAFSAWNKGASINIDEYIEFCKFIEKKYPFNKYHIVNLDVIPGKPGVIPTKQQIEYSAEKGWENYEYMKSRGLNPIHIFHQHEDWSWLYKLKDSSDYIGISPDNSQSVPSRVSWLKQVFARIKGEVKTHGFACTGPSFMEVAPFYTTDSSSWLNSSRYGHITVFDKKEKKIKHMHYADKEAFLKYFNQLPPEICDIAGLSDVKMNNSMTRDLAAVHAYYQLGEHFDKVWRSRKINFDYNFNI